MKSTISSARGRNNPATGGGRNNLPATNKEKLERRISQLKAAAIFKWIPGKFCSTHGHGVGPNHNSASCNSKGRIDDHFDTNTCNNPTGPGAMRNKGWDDWLMKS